MHSRTEEKTDRYVPFIHSRHNAKDGSGLWYNNGSQFSNHYCQTSTNNTVLCQVAVVNGKRGDKPAASVTMQAAALSRHDQLWSVSTDVHQELGDCASRRLPAVFDQLMI